MPAASFLQAASWMLWAQPRGDRALFRMVRRSSPRRVVELGLGDATRAARMLRLAARYRPGEKIEYTGIDLFEARTAGDRLPLKVAHHRLAKLGASVRLVPGDLASALPRVANLLVGTDLLVIDAEHSSSDLTSAWFYLRRMLHEQTKIAHYQHVGSDRRLQWVTAPVAARSERRAA